MLIFASGHTNSTLTMQDSVISCISFIGIISHLPITCYLKIHILFSFAFPPIILTMTFLKITLVHLPILDGYTPSFLFPSHYQPTYFNSFLFTCKKSLVPQETQDTVAKLINEQRVDIKIQSSCFVNFK